jgi:hypothetical protein
MSIHQCFVTVNKQISNKQIAVRAFHTDDRVPYYTPCYAGLFIVTRVDWTCKPWQWNVINNYPTSVTSPSWHTRRSTNSCVFSFKDKFKQNTSSRKLNQFHNLIFTWSRTVFIVPTTTQMWENRGKTGGLQLGYRFWLRWLKTIVGL